MPTLLAAVPAAPPLPSPTVATAIAWAAWLTLMGFPGLIAFALVTAGPAARRVDEGTRHAVTTRLSRCAVLLAVLAVPAVLADLAQDATTGSRYSAAWHSLYDGTSAGLLAGLEITLVLLGAVLIAPLAVRTAPHRWRRGLLVAGLVAGAAALATTKLPAEATDDLARTCWKTAVWLVHLWFGASWLGGLAGLLVLAVPGVIAPGDRGAFWSAAVRRFSAVAMTGVGAIALSGLFLYWSHVDGPSQLLSTLYGRTLGVKIVLFGALLLLGIAEAARRTARPAAGRGARDRPVVSGGTRRSRGSG